MQEELFHEDINAALSHVISALGGNKSVGIELWPSLSADQAGKKVSNCLNGDHAQQLHPCDMLWILREARKRGIHSAMAYITGECGYADPQPIEPEDEIAKLQRQYIEATKMMAGIARQMGKYSESPVKAVV